jgi:protein-S-isoprenylcysteine O-methyltransferase Ste14
MLRAQLALALQVVVVTATFGLRMLLQRRRYGDAGWRRHRVSLVGAVAQALLVTSQALLAAAPVAALAAGGAHRPVGAAWLVERGTAPATAGASVGVVLVVAGAVVTLVAQGQMGASWRIGLDPTERTKLVTGGLFRQVRNPIFSGMALWTIGQALLVPNALTGGAVVTGLVALQLWVRQVEEPHLAATHGAGYVDWAATSGRFVPGIGRLTPEP